MLITITEIDLSHPSPAPNGTELAYVCRFTCALGNGRARCVPRRDDLGSLPGQTLVVEVTQASVSDFRSLPADAQPAAARWQPLLEPGDFEVWGQVRSVLWLDDEQDNSLVEVLAADCRFEFSPEGADRPDFGYGEWITFRVRGLVLWGQ